MSQVKSKRAPNTFVAVDNARKLAVYTIQICDNEKVFLPAHHTTTDEIKTTAQNIYLDLRAANGYSIRANDPERQQNLVIRRRLKERALHNCDKLLGLISISHQLYHLSLRRVKYWGQMVVDQKAMIRGWMDER